MKYIISESQYKLLLETDTKRFITRRITKDLYKRYIEYGRGTTLIYCGEVGDFEEYVQGVLMAAVNAMIEENEDFANYFFTQDTQKSSEIQDFLFDLGYNWFLEYLKTIYENYCSSEKQKL